MLLSILVLHALLMITTEFFARKSSLDRLGEDRYNLGMNTLIHSFLFLWTLVGVVWLLDDPEECIDGKIHKDYFIGFLIGCSILLMYYGILAIFSICMCCIILVSCYGSSRLVRFTKEYEEIN